MKMKHFFMIAACAVLSSAAFFCYGAAGAAPAKAEPAKVEPAKTEAPKTEAANAEGAKTEAAKTETKAEDAKVKPLVVYWTWSETHNTKVVAEMLKEKTGADIMLIELVTPYPTDFGGVMQAGQRDLAQKKAPAIKEMKLDLSKYDPIYVGTPIWFSTYAPPVRTFLQSFDFKGKTVALFCTHGQGNPATFTYLKDAKAAIPEIKYFDEVFAFKGADAKNAGPALDAWIQKVSAKTTRGNVAPEIVKEYKYNGDTAIETITTTEVIGDTTFQTTTMTETKNGNVVKKSSTTTTTTM